MKSTLLFDHNPFLPGEEDTFSVNLLLEGRVVNDFAREHYEPRLKKTLKV